MKELRERKTITFKWWRSDGEEIREQDAPLLRKEANEHISRMMAEGDLAGQLFSEMPDGDEVIVYQGWWDVWSVND